MKLARLVLTCSVCLVGGVAYSAPLFPVITGHDFNFGAHNFDGPPEWNTNGVGADTLNFTASSLDHEVTAYWPNWPNPPVLPIFSGQGFGGDLVLSAQFTGQDAPIGSIDVSLTGTGGNVGAPDLLIFGNIGGPGNPVLLWALDLDQVSLYGNSNHASYILEGVGTIVGGLVADQNGLIGQTGVMRGNLDFQDAPQGWIPSLYHPLRDPSQFLIRAAYSGETGVGYAVPEPGTLSLALGALLLLRRRRSKA